MFNKFMAMGILLLQIFTSAAEPTLHSSTEINDCLYKSSGNASFAFTGIVELVSSRVKNGITVSDPTGRVRIYLSPELNMPSVGDEVFISGQVRPSGLLQTSVLVQNITVLGKKLLPHVPTVKLTALSESKHHLGSVEVEGTVIDITTDDVDQQYAFLLLKDEGLTLPIAFPIDEYTPDRDKLINATVRLSGIFWKTTSGLRRFSGPFIDLDCQRGITIVKPAPSNLFEAAPLDQTVLLSPKEVSKLGLRTIKGNVIARWGNNQFLMQDSRGYIAAVRLADGNKLPAYGDHGIAVGYPDTTPFLIYLTQAHFKPSPDSPPFNDDRPKSIIADEIIDQMWHDHQGRLCHGMLMKISGRLIFTPKEQSPSERMLIQSGSHKVQIDLSAMPHVVADIPMNSVVEVTGRCIVEFANSQISDPFPHIKDFILIPRKPDDIHILRRPPWWTPQRLLAIIGVLLLALVGVYVRNRILKRMGELKVGERTRLAVELHDSLSQTLAGVACQIAASDNAIDAENAVAKDRIKTAERMLKSCRTELRHCLFDLRSDTLEEKDFSAALRKTLDQLEGDADIAIRFNVPRSLLDDAVAHAIIAIVRELTGNALRHGNATKVRVAGSVEDGRVLFSVTDNGCGFDPARCAGSLEGHFGLEGIRDRMKKLRGTFEIASTPDKGTKAVLSLPL